MPEARRTSDPVTADDVTTAVRLAARTLRAAESADWDAKAGSLEWSCWETVEHLADDLFAYAAQLGPEQPPSDREVPFVWSARRPGGPPNVVFADRAAGPAGLVQVLEASGALLAAMVRTTAPDVRAHHVFGATRWIDRVFFLDEGRERPLSSVWPHGGPWWLKSGVCVARLLGSDSLRPAYRLAMRPEVA